MLFSPQILVRRPPARVVSSAYTGPGDIVSGAYFWGGLRAYNAAYATGSNPALDLVDQAGANPLTVNILSTGRLDVASINTWVTANSVSTIKVTKLYDQTGNARHVVEATLTNMPVLNLTGFGSLPAIVFTAASSHRLKSTGTYTLSQPNTFSFVYNRTSGGSNFQEALGFQNDATIFMPSGGGANTLYLQANSGSADVTATVATWHAVQGIFNSASSAAYVDGSGTTGLNPGSSGVTTRAIFIAGQPSLANYYGGSIAEFGIWNSAFNATQAGDMNTNQHHATNGYNF